MNFPVSFHEYCPSIYDKFLAFNRLKYVEQELAKKRGKNVTAPDQIESDLKQVEDELYKVPEHLKVSVS